MRPEARDGLPVVCGAIGKLTGMNYAERQGNIAMKAIWTKTEYKDFGQLLGVNGVGGAVSAPGTRRSCRCILRAMDVSTVPWCSQMMVQESLVSGVCSPGGT